jgi:hypothetical protein
VERPAPTVRVIMAWITMVVLAMLDMAALGVQEHQTIQWHSQELNGVFMVPVVVERPVRGRPDKTICLGLSMAVALGLEDTLVELFILVVAVMV